MHQSAMGESKIFIEVGEDQGLLDKEKDKKRSDGVEQHYPFKSSLYDPNFVNGHHIRHCLDHKLRFSKSCRIHCLSIEDETLLSDTWMDSSHISPEQAFRKPVEGRQPLLTIYLIPLQGHKIIGITHRTFIEFLEYAQIPPHFAAVLADNNGITTTSQGHLDEKGIPGTVELLVKAPLAPAINGSVYFNHDLQSSETKVALFFHEHLLDRLKEVLQHNTQCNPASKTPMDPFLTLSVMMSESAAMLEDRRREIDDQVQLQEGSTGVTMMTRKMREASIDEYATLFSKSHLCQQDLMYMERTIAFQAQLVGFFQEQHTALTSLRQRRATSDAARAQVFAQAQKTTASFGLSASQLQHMAVQVGTLSQRIRMHLAIVEARLSQASARNLVAISEETKRDSMAMKTIAAVTMLFLPGTFTASLFAMPFFGTSSGNGQGEEFEVSKWFWVYVAITVPLTLMVLLAWMIWQRWLSKKSILHPHKDADVEKGCNMDG